LIRCTET
jgi:hypothetical protein